MGQHVMGQRHRTRRSFGRAALPLGALMFSGAGLVPARAADTRQDLAALILQRQALEGRVLAVDRARGADLTRQGLDLALTSLRNDRLTIVKALRLALNAQQEADREIALTHSMIPRWGERWYEAVEAAQARAIQPSVAELRSRLRAVSDAEALVRTVAARASRSPLTVGLDGRKTLADVGDIAGLDRWAGDVSVGARVRGAVHIRGVVGAVGRRTVAMSWLSLPSCHSCTSWQPLDGVRAPLTWVVFDTRPSRGRVGRAHVGLAVDRGRAVLTIRGGRAGGAAFNLAVTMSGPALRAEPRRWTEQRDRLIHLVATGHGLYAGLRGEYTAALAAYERQAAAVAALNYQAQHAWTGRVKAYTAYMWAQRAYNKRRATWNAYVARKDAAVARHTRWVAAKLAWDRYAQDLHAYNQAVRARAAASATATAGATATPTTVATASATVTPRSSTATSAPTGTATSAPATATSAPATHTPISSTATSAAATATLTVPAVTSIGATATPALTGAATTPPSAVSTAAPANPATAVPANPATATPTNPPTVATLAPANPATAAPTSPPAPTIAQDTATPAAGATGATGATDTAGSTGAQATPAPTSAAPDVVAPTTAASNDVAIGGTGAQAIMIPLDLSEKAPTQAPLPPKPVAPSWPGAEPALFTAAAPAAPGVPPAPVVPAGLEPVGLPLPSAPAAVPVWDRPADFPTLGAGARAGTPAGRLGQAFAGELLGTPNALGHENVSRDQAIADGALDGAGAYADPLHGVVTTYFGGSTVFQSFHPAVDIAAPLYTPIHAAAAGKVVWAGLAVPGDPHGSYGDCVIIEHNERFSTLYAHMDNQQFPLQVRAGDQVQQGQIIGYEGLTGWTTGPHLHFEVRDAGMQIDPLLLIPDPQQ